MHTYDYPNIEGVVYYYYYPMFQLAVTYLLDANGHGKSMRDLKDLYLDVRNGAVFATAFRDRMEIGLADYEAQFFDLMTDYLQ